MTFEGTPDEPYPGNEGGDWPKGWVKRMFERTGGATKGQQDRYWYSPNIGFRLRSMVEVKRFVTALDRVDGDEEKAKKIFKNMPV
mmetsp:Transcript_20402/g.57666  ORF Transcript_20402/g.57666 Transcript_20402/m.57666 type:complete len:85 (+) Transcript_20402:1-255(+)